MTEQDEKKAVCQALKVLHERGEALGLPRARLDRVADVQSILNQFYSCE